MDVFISALINNPKLPKWLRFTAAAAVCGFVIFIGVMLILKSPMLIGKIFGGVLSVLFIAAAVCLFARIASKK